VFYFDNYTETQWNNQTTCELYNQLFACDDDVAPQYYQTAGTEIRLQSADKLGVKEICLIVVDAKKLPRNAIERKRSPQGFYYYKINYSISIRFGTTLEFRLKYNGKEYASGKANYL